LNSRIRSLIAWAYLALCLLFGGASAAGAVGNAFLQIVGIILILALMWSRRLVLPEDGKALAWIMAAFVGVALLSLVPLPPSIWEQLPYRGEVAEGLRMLGIGAVALPVSLAPAATIASLLWVVPPLAMFLLIASLPHEHRRPVAAVVIALAIVSIGLGVSQLVGGPNSPLRFYAITNSGSPVGFFANINHQATLILCALPCVAVLAARFATRADRSRRGGGSIISIAALVFLTAGIAIAGSTAGYGLFLPAAFTSLLIYRRAVAGKLGARWKAGFAALLVVFVGVALVGPLSQESLSNKFSENPTSRRTMATTTLEAIGETFPVGSGLGTFANVYRRFEDPGQATNEYVNHAHNDYLEVVLELGLAGILLVFAFLAWWLIRSWRLWGTDQPGANLARAGSVIVGIVLMHSLVDYPLRTSAIAALFATGCALMTTYSGRSRQRRQPTHREKLRHLEAN